MPSSFKEILESAKEAQSDKIPLGGSAPIQGELDFTPYEGHTCSCRGSLPSLWDFSDEDLVEEVIRRKRGRVALDRLEIVDRVDFAALARVLPPST